MSLSDYIRPEYMGTGIDVINVEDVKELIKRIKKSHFVENDFIDKNGKISKVRIFSIREDKLDKLLGDALSIESKKKNDAYKGITGCGEIKEDLGNRVCWRKNLCKDCMNIRSKNNALSTVDAVGGKK